MLNRCCGDTKLAQSAHQGFVVEPQFASFQNALKIVARNLRERFTRHAMLAVQLAEVITR
jgi:hypothetical protein